MYSFLGAGNLQTNGSENVIKLPTKNGKILEAEKTCSFISRNYLRYIWLLGAYIRLSVCLTVTCRYSIETSKHIINFFSPWSNHITSF